MSSRNRFVLGMLLISAATTAVAADQLKVKGLAASCSNCHGTNGVAQQGMESLAGQPKDELLKKMLDFKSGKKPATIMHQLSKGYSDEQLEQMAVYFSGLKK